MTLDIDRMKMIVENLYVAEAEHSFGRQGVHALQFLLATLVEIYRTLDPSTLGERLVVFIRSSSGEIRSPDTNPKSTVSAARHITHELDKGCCVELTPAGQLVVYDHAAFEPDALSAQAIVYVYQGGTEWFSIGGKRFDIINPTYAHSSVFARPTFSSLKEALERYRVRSVRYTRCFLLREAWADDKRLFFRPRPEETMRQSLHQFLGDSFPEAEVRPEQVVDESHPIDIKITWSETNQRALIEIKWLGKSRDERGHITVDYHDNRAREGAKQLADYLDANKTGGPGLRSRGYLVVIDGRRYGLNETTSAVDEKNGLYYRDRDVDYNPKYDEIRDDFDPPKRMFAEPILN